MTMKRRGLLTNSDLGVIICCHVLKEGAPILIFENDQNEWQFLCGKDSHSRLEDAEIIHAKHLTAIDPTLDISFLSGKKNVRMQRNSINEKWFVIQKLNLFNRIKNCFTGR